MNIEEIEGIGPAQAALFREQGVTTVEKLLEVGGTKAGRNRLAEATALPEFKILKYVNHADLIRINGIGPQFAELLEAAGVDTVKELSRRKADNLLERMREENELKNLVNRLPTMEALQKMIDEAKKLPDVLNH